MVSQIRTNKIYDVLAFSIATGKNSLKEALSKTFLDQVGCTYALLKDYKTETIATPFRNFVIGHFNRIFIDSCKEE